ncbi:VacJ family lipoprotein [Pikeienuella piscinae]|uniref:VacJ family lipoprotein n=1 Tax=Pikeienuella piscinae TaxID=2748098 RepID=A0A7L5BZY4_9RHOB|nr:VacJ family lipoprotein [Pikeienuella piscinae]QIE57041.1 VacJ family lipoprotein [Pikeienuella piscinae]
MSVERFLAVSRVGVCAAALFSAGCAMTPSVEGALIADPYEDANRAFHGFNKDVDTLVLRPVAEGYDLFTPALVKHLVKNELEYLRLPAIFLNRVMQGNIEEAGAALARFALNTTIGAVGLLDPATEFGLPHEPTDFGVTLALWGADEGVYHELPVFGPRTTRDMTGLFASFVLDPTILITFGFVDVPGVVTAIDYSRTGIQPVVIRYENADLVDQILYETDDSYVSVRTGYVQSRRQFVAGETSVEQLPDIFGDASVQ